MTVDLRESSGDLQYQSPDLRTRHEETYSTDQLDLLSPGAGGQIAMTEDLIEELIAVLSVVDAGYIRYIFSKGIKTDAYEPLPDTDVLDPTGGVFDVPAQQIVRDAGVVPGDDQFIQSRAGLKRTGRRRLSASP